MLAQVYGDNAMKNIAVYKWVIFWGKRKCHWRREIRMASNKQKWRKHCKSSSNCAWKSLAVRSIAEQVHIDKETVKKIWTEDLDIRMVCAKMVPKELTEEQKQTVTICQDLLERHNDILGHVITGDETWVNQYDPETKQWSAQWKTANSPRSKKFCRSKSRAKAMLLTFFWYKRDCSLWICTNWTNSQPSLLFGSTGILRKKDGNDRNVLPTTHGSCIMMMHLLTRHCLWGSF